MSKQILDILDIFNMDVENREEEQEEEQEFRSGDTILSGEMWNVFGLLQAIMLVVTTE